MGLMLWAPNATFSNISDLSSTYFFMGGGNQNIRRVPLIGHNLLNFLNITELTIISADRYPGRLLGHATILKMPTGAIRNCNSQKD